MEDKAICRCVGCRHVEYDQFKGYPGQWLCFHPYRNEISNSGDFTYPGNFQPQIQICSTPPESYNEPRMRGDCLANAKTPKWCYFEVVERTKIEMPGFDPDKQREVLWPEKIKREAHV